MKLPSFAVALLVALFVAPATSSAFPLRLPDTPETSPACNAADACACSYGGSCLDVCESTWCAGLAPTADCVACMVRPQTSCEPACGYDFAACYAPVCSSPSR
jgi:hypothetical protein